MPWKKIKYFLKGGSIGLFFSLGILFFWENFSAQKNTALYTQKENYPPNNPPPFVEPWENFLQEIPFPPQKFSPTVSKKQTLIFRVNTNISIAEEGVDSIEQIPLVSTSKTLHIFPLQVKTRAFLENEDVSLFKISRKIFFP